MKDWYLRTPAALSEYTLKFRTFILLWHDGCHVWNRNCLPFRNTRVDSRLLMWVHIGRSLVYCAVFCRLLYWLLLWCLQTLLRECNPTYRFFKKNNSTFKGLVIRISNINISYMPNTFYAEFIFNLSLYCLFSDD